MLGITEIVIVLIVVILLFGAKKLPDLARSMGKSARILKSEVKAMKSDAATPPAAEASGAASGEHPGERPAGRPTSQGATRPAIQASADDEPRPPRPAAQPSAGDTRNP